ncbi:MAG: cytochrome b/b6 domain-containing protein [Thermodesulfovibrionales bacterium]|nr:cytochrome b/b6 domain-containing protein [Thermodesulfovibrionales bacterium]
MQKIKRHNKIERMEHWIIAFSGIVLLFTGLGCLPLYKRYMITDIPGFAWTADFWNVTVIHYISAIFFTCAVVFHIVYHSIRGDFGLIPRLSDFKESIKFILAAFGIGHEPPADKFLPEQRVAYLGIGIVVLTLVITGIIKVLKNLQWLVLSPTGESINTLIHTIMGMVFMIMLIIHIAFVVFIKENRHLFQSMISGNVKAEYAMRRHPIWYERIKDKSYTP